MSLPQRFRQEVQSLTIDFPDLDYRRAQLADASQNGGTEKLSDALTLVVASMDSSLEPNLQDLPLRSRFLAVRFSVLRHFFGLGLPLELRGLLARDRAIATCFAKDRRTQVSTIRFRI